MNEWSAKSDALFATVRDAQSPTEEDARRNYEALATRIAAVAAGTAVASTALKGSSVAPTSVVAKAVGVPLVAKITLAVAVASGAGAVTAVFVTRAAHAPTAVEARPHAPSAVVVRPVLPTAATTAAAAPAAAVDEVARTATTREQRSLVVVPRGLAPDAHGARVVTSHAAPKSASASAGEADIGSELALLAAARDSLRRGDAAGALATLDTYEAHYAHGTFSQEAAGARVLALCAARRYDEAKAARAAFLSAYPDGPLAPRVRASCAE